MAASPDTVSMAMFCDFENVALGVRDAKYEKFDIKPVLERLLLKGSIVLKKAYCDWERYKSFKAAMHEANFELIEIPHVRQSGKNSADIRMVVDALDLCYTKSHVDTFVIVSGDSDFSPLVSKLRENNKHVIGVGVKQSTSDLLIANCDEFIFYDDLVREVQRNAARRDAKSAQHAPKRNPEEDKKRREEQESRKSEAVELAVATFDALVAERGDSGKIWASMLKEAIKRRRPDFNETYFGFRAFGNLLEEAQARGLLELGRDEKSGAFVSRSSAAGASANGDGAAADEGTQADQPTAAAGAVDMTPEAPAVTAPEAAPQSAETVADEAASGAPKRRSRGGSKRQSREKSGKVAAVAVSESGAAADSDPLPPIPAEPAAQFVHEVAVAAGRPVEAQAGGEAKAADASVPVSAGEPTAAAEPAPAKKPAARSRRPRKPKAAAADAQ